MNDVEMNNHESLVLTVSMYGSASYKVDVVYSDDRSVIDTKVAPIGKAATSGMAQVVLDGVEFGSPEYMRRAVASDEAIQLVITTAMKQLAEALSRLRDTPSYKEDGPVHLNSLTPSSDDSVN